MARAGAPWRVEATPFGQWLEDTLRERDMTMTAFAEALDVSTKAVDGWRRGTRYPSLLTAARMARVLDVPAGRIVHEAAKDAAERNVTHQFRKGT